MFSQYEEEKIITEFFKNLATGELKFLDIGANDGITFSNTHKLALLNWQGVCLDPSPKAFQKLKSLYENYDNVFCYNFGISLISGKLELHESGNWIDRNDTPVGILSCIDPSEKNRFYGMEWNAVLCDFMKFDDFLNMSPIKKFDFINIDCEGHDYQVLSQIDLNSIGCKMVCIEFTSENHIDKYKKYFSMYGFKEYYRTKDNLIFTHGS